ncbi:hypothetical protein P8452_42191 [Trifolium repens]|nr:hypothetical protein P8452_42191 [Trifolium repens]
MPHFDDADVFSDHPAYSVITNFMASKISSLITQHRRQVKSDLLISHFFLSIHTTKLVTVCHVRVQREEEQKKELLKRTKTSIFYV